MGFRKIISDVLQYIRRGLNSMSELSQWVQKQNKEIFAYQI